MEDPAVELLSLKTPIGVLVLKIQERGLYSISFTDTSHRANAHPKTRLGRLAYSQLMRYFDKAHDRFTIPLVLPERTLFRRRVWNALAKIKIGGTASYKQIAQKLNTHPRAIGGACAANPIPIIIPCHRVIAQSGVLCGYTGADGKQDLSIKAWLLNHESSIRRMS